MAKKRGGAGKHKKNFQKRLPGILWFVLGIVITLWTLLWLLISLNNEKITPINSVFLFGIGFYSMIIFIVGTLIYYICRFIHKIKKKKHKKKVEKSKIKKKQVKKKTTKSESTKSKSVSTQSAKLKKKTSSKKKISKKKKL
jgi:uncharacterized protein YacL